MRIQSLDPEVIVENMKRYIKDLDNCLQCPACITDIKDGSISARTCAKTKKSLPKSKIAITPPDTCPLEECQGG